MMELKPGLYRHFKGNLYRPCGTSAWSATATAAPGFIWLKKERRGCKETRIQILAMHLQG